MRVILTLAATVLTLAVGVASLPACQYEESKWCRWDASQSGNGQGRSFTDLGGMVIYWP